MDKRKYIILVILGLFTISLSILMGGSGNMVLADSMESVYPLNHLITLKIDLHAI
jgi:hypothetical protein